jgi:NifU-like protein involved in Fe-S cluster formation
VYLKLDGNLVSAFAQEVKACALGQASSSIMGRNVIGSTPEELRAIGEEVYQMLKAGAEPPSGKWTDLALFEPVRELQARHASILLTFNAVVDALEILSKRTERKIATVNTFVRQC